MRKIGSFGKAFSFGLLTAVAGSVCSCWAADGIWNWSTSEALNGTTPTNMALWNTAANWVDNAPPAGDMAVAYLVPSNRVTSMAAYGARYIRVPDEGVDIGEVNIRQYATIYLTGGPIRFGTRSTLNANMPRIRDEGTTCTAYYYCPIDFTRKGTTLNKAYFCGPVLYQTGTTLANSSDVRYYANAWATNTDTVVTNPFPDVIFSPGSGNCCYLPRMSAGAQTGTWQTFAGSSVLLRTGAVHDLAAGATVSGTGIPAGAFVKRIYSSGAIELSANCTADSGDSGVTVAFSAFQNVRTIQHVTRLVNQSGSGGVLSHYFSKYRAEDIFDVHVDNVGSYVNLTTVPDNQRSFAANQVAYYPARIFLKSASLVGTNYIQIQNTHLVFDPEDGATFSLNAADLANSANFDTWGPRFETPTGVTATIQNIRRWTLTVIKDGEGTLDITSATNIAHNALIAEKGLTVLRMTASTANQTFASLAVSNGASLKLAEGTLAITSATVVAGATLIAGKGAVLDISSVALPAGVMFKGPGTFVVKESSVLSGAVLEDVPVFRFANAGTARDIAPADDVVPAVVGHPAFWVDAAKNVDLITFEWNGVTYTNGVTCWRDCRDGETTYYATNDFSQLTEKTGVPSRYEANTYSGLPCVWHEGIATTNITNYRSVQSGLVWNRPITNVCAVFNVVYAYGSGGNAMLGCTKRFLEMGAARNYNDFGRGINSGTDGGGVGTWSNYLLASGVPAWIRNGWLYVNGQEWDLSAKMPSTGSIPYVLEAHPLAPYGRADAFAIQEHAGVTSSGCQRQMECIIYTNELTLAERQQVCAYLMKKYRNATVGYSFSDSRFMGKSNLDTLDASHDVGVDVAAGAVMGFTTLTNNATLLKTGAGTLYADLVDGASLDVREGEVIIRSLELTADVVPSGSFVHLDATATNRMTLTPKTYLDGVARTEVTHWRDVSGASPVSAQRRTSDSRYMAPYLFYPESLGGKPVVDYGALTNINTAGINLGWGLFHDLVWKETDSGSMNYTNLSKIGSAFLMIGSKNGGGVPLGGYATTQWRSATADPAVPFFNSSAPAGSRTGDNWLNGAKTIFTITGLSGGYDLVSFRDTAGTACNVQSLMMANSRIYTGGGELGEVLVYEEPLSYYTHQIVDAWLNWKWFARKTVGYAPSVASNVTVAAGATLTVEGGTPLTVTRLAGSGAIDGSVALASGAELGLVINDNGTITPLTVSGTADLSAGGTVTLTGDIAKLTPGSYLLVSCTSGAAGLWNVAYTGTSTLQYFVRARPDGIYLDVLSPGTSIILK